MKKIPSLVFLLLGCLPGFLNAQELMGTASSTIDTNGYSISWSVGEIVILTDTVQNLTLTQGYHQPGYLILSIDRVTNTEDQGNFRLYPNPFQHELNLNAENFEEESFTATLTDMTGKVLHRFDLTNGENRLDIPPLADAQYLLLVRSESGRYQEHFKIIKSQ